MKFNDKLSLLMHMQNIPNNKLAKALSVDPSLVSRWRNGTRDMPKRSEYIELIAQYIATHATDLKSMTDVLSLDCTTDPCESECLSEQICHWLSDDLVPDLNLVNNFIERLNHSKAIKLPTFEQENFKRYASGKKLSAESFTGTEGKRNAVIKFLDEVIRSKECTTLLLYSDESMEWLTEDAEFSNLWAQMLVHILKLGHKIRIIHTINRNINELLSAIDNWLPLYMTGAIEPYYYPSYQESIFKRSLFVAPGIAALTSNTISDSKTSEQLYHRDPQIIRSLELEYETYLKYCRPLMHIYTKNSMDRFRTLLHEFESQENDVAYIAPSPSLALFPHGVIDAQLNRMALTPDQQKVMLDYYTLRQTAFSNNLANNKHCEWLYLPEAHLFMQSDFFPEPTLDWFFGTPISLTKLEFINLIEHLILLLKEHRNFHLQLTAPAATNDSILIVKKNIGVIVCKVIENPVCFALNHPTMVSAFQSYIDSIFDCKQPDAMNKTHILTELEQWISDVKKQ